MLQVAPSSVAIVCAIMGRNFKEFKLNKCLMIHQLDHLFRCPVIPAQTVGDY